MDVKRTISPFHLCVNHVVGDTVSNAGVTWSLPTSYMYYRESPEVKLGGIPILFFFSFKIFDACKAYRKAGI